MPYDEAEKVWKFHVIDENGQLSGAFFTPRPNDRNWTGKLKSNLVEILYRAQDEVGVSYFLVHRFYKSKGFDCCKILNSSKAAKWLTNEGYPLPDDLEKTVEVPQGGLVPLPDAQEEIWDLLEGQALTAKELAQKVRAAPVSPSSIIKRIQAIKRNGRTITNRRGRGYYRPDAPPPNDTGGPPDSE